jgi:hypothetical protein
MSNQLDHSDRAIIIQAGDSQITAAHLLLEFCIHAEVAREGFDCLFTAVTLMAKAPARYL